MTKLAVKKYLTGNYNKSTIYRRYEEGKPVKNLQKSDQVDTRLDKKKNIATFRQQIISKFVFLEN
jgi:hypothetical protein